ncbi:MAG: sensor histidine kinase N-terminal domain-containing protein [Methylotetracoccus sp.]
MGKPSSLRTQLMLRLAVPMAFFVVVDAAVSYFVALHYANVAFDRWLLDSARSLAQEVKAQKGRPSLELPPSALEIFQWDEVDKTTFRIDSMQFGFLAGDPSIPMPTKRREARREPSFLDRTIRDQRVRVVSMLVVPKDSDDEVLVQVAETINKRRGMMTDILLAVLLPQLMLVVASGTHVWIGIHRGLSPLRALTLAVAQRSPRDLTLIPDTQVPHEVRVLTRTINDLLGQLASVISAQQRFIANAAHQLRTPLAGLKVQVERALGEDDAATRRPALVQIDACVERASRLSSQLLVLARSESAAQHASALKIVDLGSIARSTAIDWVPRALQRGIEIAFYGPRQPVLVDGDAALLRELLDNLLDNAVRYGRDRGHIAVVLRDGAAPMLRVEDDGPGIAEAERERVFERFYRIPGSPGDGCGLGLAIVREIADTHGAGIVVRARSRQRGTRIELRFPAAADSAPLRA